jgi:hypothetical protein
MRGKFEFEPKVQFRGIENNINKVGEKYYITQNKFYR